MNTLTTTDFAAALESARAHLLRGADASVLYKQWFHEETGHWVTWPSVAAYRAAIADAGRLERGWVVVSPVGGLAGGMLVQRGGRQRVVAPPEMTPEDDRNLVLSRGHRVRVDPVATTESDGFWHAWSAVWQVRSPEHFERIYFRVRPDQARTVAMRLVRSLPRRLAWAMKALCGTHDAGRRDNALLYLPVGTVLRASWMPNIINSVSDLCTGELPPFVHPIGSGIGWARDPGGRRSFGEAVCEVVATAAEFADDSVAFVKKVQEHLQELPSLTQCPVAIKVPVFANGESRRSGF